MHSHSQPQQAQLYNDNNISWLMIITWYFLSTEYSNDLPLGPATAHASDNSIVFSILAKFFFSPLTWYLMNRCIQILHKQVPQYVEYQGQGQGH